MKESKLGSISDVTTARSKLSTTVAFTDSEPLSRIIEETYSRVYTLMVVERQRADSVELNRFLFEFLRSKFKNMDSTVTSMFASIVYSSFKFKDKYPDCDIFYKFISDFYQPRELSYFIFLRAIIERGVHQIFFEKGTHKEIDVRQFYLNPSDLDHTIFEIFGYGNSTKSTRFKQKLNETFPELRLGAQIKTYVFLNFCIHDYFRCRKGQDKVRTVAELKTVDEVAGLNYKVLNQKQAEEGVNRRLIKGLRQGILEQQMFRDRRQKEIEEWDAQFAEEEEVNFGGEDGSQEEENIFEAQMNQDKDGFLRNGTFRGRTPLKKSPSQVDSSAMKENLTPKSNNPMDRSQKKRQTNSSSKSPFSAIKKEAQTHQEIQLDRKFRSLVRASLEKVIQAMVGVFIDMDPQSSNLRFTLQNW